ncbi:MAG: alpha/beta hydrolase [Pseudomonadota bacterium]|nr:alpha/beta hydrolase [Sphingomonas sp.]MDQ3479163.1 alpha/beta hydrolase [Pseudomonadota bacterium]
MTRFGLLLFALLALVSSPAAAQTGPPLGAGEHNVVINGVRLWYRVAGQPQGTPVVFLHGGPGQGSEPFARFAGPGLERANRMIYLDQRGSGRSEKHWKKEYSLDLMVDDLEKLRRHWNAERIALIGHSFGTVLALEYAGKYPERVSHLILTGAVVDLPAAVDVHCDRLQKLDPKLYAEALANVREGSSHRCNTSVAGRQFIDGAMYPDPAIMKLVNDAGSADGMKNTGEIFTALAKQGFMEYRLKHADRLTMPVLVIGGSRDFQAVVEPLQAFVAKLPAARLMEYEGRGHYMFVEEPDRFARDVSAFLAK